MASGIYSIEEIKLYFDEVEAARRGTSEPQSRIGIIHPTVQEKTGSAPASISEGFRVGNVTIIGSDFQDISFYSGFKQGRNIKNLQDFYRMNLPLLRANNCQYYKTQRLSGEIDHSLEITRDIAAGQNDLVNRSLINLPFDDRNTLNFYDSTSTSVTGSHLIRYINAGEYVLGYPIVTDNFVDMENYNDPDATDSFSGGFFRDATIEPLGLRNSFYNPNTNFANIMIEGVRGAFMPYTNDQAEWSDKKGSNVIDNKLEFKQSTYDWFEDCQDMAFSELVFPIEGVLTGSQPTVGSRGFSKEGYVSDGVYGISPFVDASVDKRYFKGAYRQLTKNAADELLASSSSTLSLIGSRFKSAHNGHIMAPKYDSVVQTVFGGTDSVAFYGLMKG